MPNLYEKRLHANRTDFMQKGGTRFDEVIIKADSSLSVILHAIQWITLEADTFANAFANDLLETFSRVYCLSVWERLDCFFDNLGAQRLGRLVRYQT